ncbi:MAG: 3' terminal RNA ribose 2'-O-methyltransferase Hen1 [Pseudonocardia sp.]
MLITISTTRAPATDLGFLLHKHPDRVQAYATTGGTAHVCYPEAGDERCTAALLLEVDPVGLVRRGGEVALAEYVDDRPYAASSLVAVALREVFRTAMAGRCAARPELAATSLPLEIEVAALPCRGGVELAERFFGPLGWRVEVGTSPLDETVPEWGDAPHVALRLAGELRLADALNHLYVLIPALDGAKHYRFGADEVDKLLRAGSGWLETHPERELITRRYLGHRRELTRDALVRLAEIDDTTPERLDDAVPAEDERPTPLRLLRVGPILAVLRAAGARRVADLGCGEGLLVGELLADRSFTEIVAVDVSARALAVAARRLKLDRLPEPQRARLTIFQSSLVYTDERLRGLDAAVLCEVVEHVDPPRLGALEHAVFGAARPGLVVVTTPNVEHNVRYGLDGPRHRDHRFEWTRSEFRAWAGGLAAAHGYTTRFLPVGDDDPEVGPPTQLAVLTREAP